MLPSSAFLQSLANLQTCSKPNPYSNQLGIGIIQLIMSKYKSPAKKIRSLKRIFTFLMEKTKSTISIQKNLTICHQMNISMPANSTTKLAVFPQLSISIPRILPNLTFSKSTILDISQAQPKPTYHYHPYVLEAIKLMYAKAPDELTSEEWNQFHAY